MVGSSHLRPLLRFKMSRMTLPPFERFYEQHRPRADADLPELESLDGRPAFAQLEHLADQLPPTERAAVVLRYGYDLDYSDIGAALGSNATAARQAASAGIRRLRQKELR